jgi:hypothetical protein
MNAGNAGFQSLLHHPEGFFAVDRTLAPSGDGKVLGIAVHGPPLHHPVPGDDAVPGNVLLVDVKPGDPGLGKEAQLQEGLRVEKIIDPFPGGHLSPAVLAFHGLGAGQVEQSFPFGFQFGKLLSHGLESSLRLVSVGNDFTDCEPCL